MTVYTGMGTNTELMSRIFVGTVEENIDPLRRARVKVRIQSLHDELPVDQIPWCSPLQNESGKHFTTPAIGKIVSVIFGNNSLYESYYMHCDNFNINLINKLESLSDDEYKNFIALAFDHRTQIYADDSNLTLDYLYNKVTIDNKSINAELKDNNQSLNLGSSDANQQAILGNHFIDWLDKLVDAWIKPESMIGNIGIPIVQAEITSILTEYKIIRQTFLSKNVNIVDNYKVKKLRRNPSSVSAQHDVYQADDHTVQQKDLLLKITDEVMKEDNKMSEAIPTAVINKFRNIEGKGMSELPLGNEEEGFKDVYVVEKKSSQGTLTETRTIDNLSEMKSDEVEVTNQEIISGTTKQYISGEEAEKIKNQEKIEYNIPLSDESYNPDDMLLESKWKQEFVPITDEDYNILGFEGISEGEFVEYTPQDIPYYDNSGGNGEKTSVKYVGTEISSRDGVTIKQKQRKSSSGEIIKNGEVPYKYLSFVKTSDSKGKSMNVLKMESHAAYWFDKLSEEFKSIFGYYIYISGGYRTLDGQITCKQVWTKKRNPKKAAIPGTSMHGWGQAVDIGEPMGRSMGYDSKYYTWLRNNAPKYKWDNPKWARGDGSNPESWHWEYIGTDVYTNNQPINRPLA